MGRYWILIAALVATPVIAQSDEACTMYMLWKEARGESKRTQRAVLDVFFNRMEAYGMSACQVLKQRGQYPYMRKGRVKPVDMSFQVRYNVVSGMNRVLDKNYLYFNHRRHPWGKNTLKVGRLYFSQ